MARHDNRVIFFSAPFNAYETAAQKTRPPSY